MLEKSISTILKEDGRYAVQAGAFLRDALDYTIKKYHPDGDGLTPTHVSGYQLCIGIRELALARWGYMSRFVLKYWNITCTRDFGELVYLFIEHEFMRRNENDHIEDFDDIYDFDVAFAYE